MATVIRQGLAKVEEIYHDRSRRVKELRAEGKKTFGYLCLFSPLELLTAYDLVPFRIFGDMGEPIIKADVCMPTVVCPFLRSCLELGLKGKYEFLDGMVSCHGCEVGARFASWWNSYVKTPWVHYIAMPHTIRKWEQERFTEALEDFQESLENYTAKKLAPGKIEKAIQAHNQQRALVR
jgi:benzoyl-CoA reductase subunit C